MRKINGFWILCLSVMVCLQLLMPIGAFASGEAPNDDNGQIENKKVTAINGVVSAEVKPILTTIGKPAVRVPILMFHDLSTGPSKGSTLNVDEFKMVLRALKDNNYNTITLADLYEYLTLKDVDLPANPIILTFDDGYYSNYQYAYPLLKEMNMKAVFSVIGWSIGKDECLKDTFRKGAKGQTKMIKHFNEVEMQEMVRSGVIEIENHTFDLHSDYGLSSGYHEPAGKGAGKLKDESFTNYKMRLARDLVYMNEIIKEIVGHKPMFMTYPYGFYNPESERIIKELGFKGSLTIQKGIRLYKSIDDLYEIPRIEIKCFDDLRAIKGE